MNDTSAENKPYTSQQEKFGKAIIKRICRIQTWFYRLTGGRFANRFNGGQVVLVGITGRKSGKRRVIPLVYAPDGDNIILAASMGGMSKHPIWYLNMRDNPKVDIQIGKDKRDMVAEHADDKDAERLWGLLDKAYPDFVSYRERAKDFREIPLLVLKPASEAK